MRNGGYSRKLSEEQIKQVGELRRAGMPYSKIVAIVGSDKQLVRTICRGDCYLWANANLTLEERRGISNNNRGTGTRTLDVDRVREIKQLLKSGGLTQKAISQRYGVSATIITNIRHERIWRDVQIED